MYFYLNGAMKRRLLNELKDSFSRHPVYSKIVPYIQDKYAFPERPQYGIVLKSASANKVGLSADNFVGIAVSHVALCYYGTPAYPIEWVREDQAVLQANEDRMPTVPGDYYIEILTVPTNASEEGAYVIDPLLTITQEPILYFQSGVETEGQLQNLPVRNTVRLFENGRYRLIEGTDYAVDYDTGAIKFLTPFNPGARVTASYRHAAPSLGPIPFRWNTSDQTTLPGVVIAFGKRAREGDKVAIAVTQDRVDTARIYGGKWDLTYEFDCIAQDSIQREEIADWAIMYLWAEKREFLANEGISLTEISMGGESEEPMDETGDIFMYTASVSVQIQSEWEMHVPLPFTISQVQPMVPGGGTPDPSAPSSTAGAVPTANNLVFATLPLFAGRNNDFERIR